MPPAQQRALLIGAMPALFVLIWSTGFIVARYGMPHAPPLKFLAWRFALSALCFVLWVRVSGAAWPQGRAQWRHLAVTGVLMHAGYLGGVWAAVRLGIGSVRGIGEDLANKINEIVATGRCAFLEKQRKEVER